MIDENKETIQEKGENQEIQKDEKPTQNEDSSNGIPEIESLRIQLNESNDKYLRLYSEFDNYKKRAIRDRAEYLKFAGSEILESLLPVIDDFERALKAIQSDASASQFKEGYQLIYNKLKNILTQKGISEIPSTGTEFNTDIHEAVANAPAPSDEMKGKVIDELEKGYYLNGKVLRHSKVVVGN